MKTRNENESAESVRDSSLPASNDNVDDYYQMIDWMSTRITEPPATCDLTDNEINFRIREKLAFFYEDFPCHTQAVEWTVKLVTGNSSRACIQIAREGIIVFTLASRKRIRAFESKKDFIPIK